MNFSLKRKSIGFLFAIACLSGALPACSETHVSPLRIPLDGSVWYAARGFLGPETASPASPGLRETRSFPITLNRLFPAKTHDRVRRFTVFTAFDLPRGIPDESLALYLPAVGENWAAYLNGKLIRDEMHLNEAGEMTRRRTVRGLILPLPRAHLKPGRNQILFHLAGEAPRTGLVPGAHLGFYMSGGYAIDEHVVLREQESEHQRHILSALYLFFGLYHLVLFLGRQSERYNLFFAVFSMDLALYVFLRSRLVFELWCGIDTELVYRVDYFAVFLLLPTFLYFFHYYFFSKERPFALTRWIAGISGVFLLAAVFLPFGYLMAALRVWQISVLIFIPYTVYVMGLALVRRLPESGLILFSFIPMLAATVWDLSASIFFFSTVRLFEYSFFAFVLSLVFIIARRFLRLHGEMERLNQDLSVQRQEYFSLNRDLEKEVELRTRSYRKARQEAEQAARAKGIFLANMSHEIRTPLNAILGMGELLAETKLETDQSKYLVLLRKAGAGLLALVNDILDISRIEAGEMRMESVPLDPARTAEESAAIVAGEAHKKGIALKTVCAPDLPDRVLGDQARLRQILLNLLSNAVKFTNKGSVELEVAHAPGSPRNDDKVTLEFRVRDTGIGIPADKQEHIFDAFAQADDSTTRVHGGTGLGLNICRRLAETMNGSITLRSEPRAGSEFILRLPTTVAAETRIEATHPRETNPPVRTGAPVLRILLAEDNPDNAFLFETFLKRHAVKIDLATNGLEAVMAHRNYSYDLIFMDVQMPELDGLEATRQIRATEAAESRPHTRIYALTAHAFQEDIDRSREAGCDGHLTKPFSREDLSAILSDLQANERRES